MIKLTIETFNFDICLKIIIRFIKHLKSCNSLLNVIFLNKIYFIGAQEPSVVDCRTTGCGINGECLREGAEFVCRCIPGTEGQADIECHTSK